MRAAVSYDRGDVLTQKTVALCVMHVLYPEIAPYTQGVLLAPEGDLLYWEICGNPDGKPGLVLHGGPGSGCSPWHRRLFDPSAYRVVLFDQRGCGRSSPHASDPRTALAGNRTANLVADIELLRRHLGIERWMVLGGSWGSVLALAYAQTHPDRVTGMILFGVATGRRIEYDWLFRGGVGILFPEQWERLRAAVPEAACDSEVVEAFQRRLNNADRMVRDPAALAWCTWESASLAWPPIHGLARRFADPAFRIAFARLVTHYVSNNGFLEDGILLRRADQLANIPGILINGRYDFQAPIGWTWELRRVWPRARIEVVDNAGHEASSERITRQLVRATDEFARFPAS